MDCNEIKNLLYDDALGEGTAAVKKHVQGCPACRAELDRLQMTRKLMLQGLPEEEPPRRIAFLAERPAPTNPLRFWQWSFAGAAAFALFFAVMALRQPVTQIAGPATTASPQASFSKAEVEQMVNAAVRDSEQRQRAETQQLLQTAGQRMAEQVYALQSTQSLTYRAAEQSRAEVQQVTALIGRNQGGSRQ